MLSEVSNASERGRMKIMPSFLPNSQQTSHLLSLGEARSVMPMEMWMNHAFYFLYF